MLIRAASKYFLLTLGWICVTGRLQAEGSLVEVIRTDIEKNRLQEIATRGSLAAIDLTTLTSDDERAVVLFARGMAGFKGNSDQAALNFEAAKKLFPANSPLALLTSIYYGRATVTTKNAMASLVRLKTQAKGRGGAMMVWRPEQFSLMIEILMALKQDQLLASTWSEMESRVKPTDRDEVVARKVANYLDYRDILADKHLISIVESMASGYPHSENGRWAFQKLQQLQCGPKAKKGKSEKYVFSLALISRLAANTNLDDGLKQFLIELTKGPVRDASGQVRILTEPERISYLIQIRLWNEAKRIVDEQVAALKGSESETGRQNLARALSLQGQIQVKQGDYASAVTTWSRFIELFGKDAECRMANEYLADSLARLRAHGAAAKIYQTLAKSPSSDPLLKWHHFWNTYLDGDYRGALALLDRAGYVPPRDRGVEGGLDYWRARILERLKLTAESNIIYRKILSENGDSFYALQVMARKPDLREAEKNGTFLTHDLTPEMSVEKHESNNGRSKVDLSAIFDENSSKAAPGLVVVPNHSADLRMISNLSRWSLARIGRRLLRTIPVQLKESSPVDWGEAQRLAHDMDEYSLGMKALNRLNSPLKLIPNSANQLEVHMAQFNPEWREIYPYAFRNFVEPVAGTVEIDPFLVLSLMRAESLYSEDARSGVGAQGLMQIMPFTAVRIARMMGDYSFRLSELQQPFVNIAYGSYYVKCLTSYYRGNLPLAVAAYNGGPTSVNRWLEQYGTLEMDEFIETIPFKETRNYVKSVLRNFNHYKHIWQQSSAVASLPVAPNGNTGSEIF